MSASGGRGTAGTGLETGSVMTRRPWRALDHRDETLARRIEIPLFTSEETENWVLHVEQYFELEDFTEEEKLRAVRMCFTGDALPWYRWKRNQNPFLS